MTSRYMGVSRFELFGNREAAQKLIPKARALLGMWNQLSQSTDKFRNRYIFSDGSKIEGIRVGNMWMARIFAPGGEVCIMLPPGIYFFTNTRHILENNGANLYRLNTELNPIQFEPFLQSDDYEEFDGFYIPSRLSYPYHYIVEKDNDIIPHEPVFSHPSIYNSKDTSTSLSYLKYDPEFDNIYTHTVHHELVDTLANQEDSIGAVVVENSIEYKADSESDIIGSVTVNRFHSPVTYKVTMDEEPKWDYDVSLGESPSHITLRLHRLGISECYTHGDITNSIEIANLSVDISSFKGIPYNGNSLWLQYVGISQQVYWDTYIDKDADVVRGMFILRQSIIKKEGDPGFDYTYTPMRGSRGNVVRVIELTIDRSALEEPTDNEVFTYTEVEAKQTFLGEIVPSTLESGEDIYDTFIRNSNQSGDPVSTTWHETRTKNRILGVNGSKTLKTETFDINFTLSAGYYKGVPNLFKMRAYGITPYYESTFDGILDGYQPSPLFPTDKTTDTIKQIINEPGDYRITFYDSFETITDEIALSNCKFIIQLEDDEVIEYNGSASLTTYTQDIIYTEKLLDGIVNSFLPGVVDVENRLYSFEHLHVEYNYNHEFVANTVMQNTVSSTTTVETINFTMYQKVWYKGQLLGSRELFKGNDSYPVSDTSDTTDNSPQWSPSVQSLAISVPAAIWTEVYNNGGLYEDECYDISDVIVDSHVPYHHTKLKLNCAPYLHHNGLALNKIYGAVGKSLYVGEHLYITTLSRYSSVTSEVVGNFSVDKYELSFTGDVMLNQVRRTYDEQSKTVISVNEDFLIVSRRLLDPLHYKPGILQSLGDGIWLKNGWHYIIVQEDLTALGIIDLDPGKDASTPSAFIGQFLSSTDKHIFIGV